LPAELNICPPIYPQFVRIVAVIELSAVRVEAVEDDDAEATMI
jgi:hypothetical protein